VAPLDTSCQVVAAYGRFIALLPRFWCAALTFGGELKIFERYYLHSAELPHIKPGSDAIVWFGGLDIRFENTSKSPLLLRERVDEERGIRLGT
jgi:hypothetical protein